MDASSPTRVARTTEDLLEIQELDRAAHWETSFYHFENGDTKATFRLLQSADCQVAENSFSSGVLIRGGTPAGAVVFAAAVAPEQRYQGRPVTDRDLVFIQDQDEIEYKCRGPSRILTAALGREALARALEARWGMPLQTLGQSKRLPLLPGKPLLDLQRDLAGLLSPGMSGVQAERLPPDNLLLDLFFTYAAPPDDTEWPCAYSYRRRLAEQSEDYLRVHFREPISMTSLCQELNARERTIHQGFRERYDMSPGQYLKRLRMDAARKALLSAVPESRVTEIAMNAGFTHTGRFSVEYRNCFGEPPTATLSRSRAQWTPVRPPGPP